MLPISGDEVRIAEAMLSGKIDTRFIKHGEGCYHSNHEALGVIAEEYFELIEAIKSNDDERVLAEAFDVATAAMVAVMSILVRRRFNPKT